MYNVHMACNCEAASLSWASSSLAHQWYSRKVHLVQTHSVRSAIYREEEALSPDHSCSAVVTCARFADANASLIIRLRRTNAAASVSAAIGEASCISIHVYSVNMMHAVVTVRQIPVL